MNTTPEIVQYVMQERAGQIAQARLERLAACARACRDVSASFAERFSRLLRPVVAR